MDQETLQKLEKHSQLVFEHKPRELRVAVNGNLQGTLKVNSDLNEIGLTVANKEPIEFIEVFSEQQLRLLFLNIEDSPPHPAVDSAHTFNFSDERKLEINVGFAVQGLELKLLYQDPTYKKVQLLLENPQMLDSEKSPIIGSSKKTPKSFLIGNRLFEIFSNLTNLLSFRWGKLAFAALLAVLVVGGGLFIDYQPRLSAKAVLEEAEKQKLNWQFQPDKILVWDEEATLLYGNQSPTQHYRSQHWRSNITDHKEDLILKFDDNNQLLWGKWLQEDGTLIIYNGKDLGTKVYPGIPLIKQKLGSLSEEDKLVLQKHMVSQERNLDSEKQSDMNINWMLNNYTSQLVKHHKIAGNKDAICVLIKSSKEFADSNVKGSELEIDFDEQTYQRFLYKSTIFYDDGTSSYQEIQFLSSREATLDEFKNNELSKIISEGKNIKRLSVEEFAKMLRPLYLPQTK